jgi:hypothetical protein
MEMADATGHTESVDLDEATPAYVESTHQSRDAVAVRDSQRAAALLDGIGLGRAFGVRLPPYRPHPPAAELAVSVAQFSGRRSAETLGWPGHCGTAIMVARKQTADDLSTSGSALTRETAGDPQGQRVVPFRDLLWGQRSKARSS